MEALRIIIFQIKLRVGGLRYEFILKFGLAALLVAFLVVPSLARQHQGAGTGHSSESYERPKTQAGAAEKSNISDIHVTKPVDTSSPKMMETQKGTQPGVRRTPQPGQLK